MLRAETFYRYQLTIHAGQMSRLSQLLAALTVNFQSPEEVTLSVDIDPVNLM